MEILKSEAEKLLDVSSTTFYKRVNKLGIEMISKWDANGKRSYILQSDFDKMALAMGKSIRKEEPAKKEQTPQAKAEESAPSKKKEEQFDLMVKIKEQEQQLITKWEMVDFYKEQSTVLLTQQQEAKTQINTMYLQMIKVTNKATAFGVTAIALGVLFIWFVVLVALGKLQF